VTPKKTKEMIPNIPEGILDMRGPKTLEGGYSPSQKVSSAMFMAVKGAAVFGAKATGVRTTWEVGTKAEQAATIKERTTKLSLAIVYCYLYCKRRK
jgi:hypothetical protein